MRFSLWPRASKDRKRYRRKGGGGGGRGGSSGGESSGGSRGGSSGGSSSGASSGTRSSVPLGAGSSTGGRTSATTYGNGGGSVRTIPSGQLFAGRSQGGGTRGQVFGTQTYGSGYPGVASRGVNNLGFPFYFWPVVWGSAGAGSVAYLHDSEYGDPNNSSRPGGPLNTIAYSSSTGNTTVHIMADNSTSIALRTAIASNCSTVLASNSTGSQPELAFDQTNSSMPKPEQAIQYYRASSVVLTLDGYNDTTALNGSAGANDLHTPLPSWVNTTFLSCVNETIGAAAPLVDGDVTTYGSVSVYNMGVLGLAWLVMILFQQVL
ncbi:uncharacterized protein FOMMEDRAFT_148736 [Fomitiporia mediterranea MF3/22]|uniref:uncharacterized protein n=1 Tax=Fomitiporia mediterranea (strain MF3/22) TaxID=694068 RepID=UPI000440958E|nr:uncharacterized protein FOMMEDRAFT_148736 [Fomitiporia mediterranea MF3/22]EJC99156.1 hypothetical protein FOMMEDRAFT_148736 [Fomitiporia mediterranea MF3/22]